MKKALRRNWFPKIVSLLLATAIWFLIKDHLSEQDNPDARRSLKERLSGRDDADGRHVPRAIPVPEE